MASIYGNYTKETRLRLDYSITSQSIESNTSTIRLDLYAEKTAHSGYNRTGNSYYNMTGKGNTTVNWDWGSSSSQYYLGSSTTTVAHNADGTASTTLNGYWYLGNTTQYMPTELSVSGTITLPTIPRASSISLSSSNITLGQNLTININRASNNFTHLLYWQIGDGNWNTIVSNVATTYTWNVPKSLANSFPNTTSQTFRIICETYNGSNYIGSKSQNFTATISNDIKPLITSLTLKDTTSNSVYIETLSKINVKTVASGSYGSTVNNYTVEMVLNGKTKKTLYGNNVTFDLNNLNITENTTITIKSTVTDSRGKTNTLSKTITVYKYVKPYIISKSTFRCDASGAQDENGTYLSLSWNYYVTTSIPENIAKPLVQYRQKGSTSWTNVSLNNNSTIIIGEGNISTDNQYEVKYAIGDNYYSNTSIFITDIIQTGYVTVDYRAGGKGIAFGKVSEKDEFECDMPADFKKDITWNAPNLNNTNYNDMIKSGTYYMMSGCNNVPNDDYPNYYRLLVMGNQDSGDIVQIATQLSTSETALNRTYIRSKVNGTWKAWKAITVGHSVAKNIQTNGWYTVATLKTYKNVMLEIYTNFYNLRPSSIVIHVSTSYQDASITQLNAINTHSANNADEYATLRNVRVRFANDIFYVEVYYNTDTLNSLYVENISMLREGVNLVEPVLTAGTGSVVDELEINYGAYTTKMPVYYTCSLSSNVSYTGTAWGINIIRLNSAYNYYTKGKLGFNGNDGSISIGANVSKVKISASISWYNYSSTGEVDLLIRRYRGGTYTNILSVPGVNALSNIPGTISLTPVIVNVQKGDVFYLAFTKNTANSLTVLSSGNCTKMTIEAVA